MSNISSLKHFAKGDDVRRKVNARKGTGAKDKLKKMVEEIEEQTDDLTRQEINEKIIKRLEAQSILGDIDSIKLLSKLVPISSQKSTEEFKKISEKKITDQASAIIKSVATRKITTDEATTHLSNLKVVIEVVEIPKLEKQLNELQQQQKTKDGK